MNRKEFLSLLGLGTTATFLFSSLGSCKKEDPAPEQVDFTIDLNDPAYGTLKSHGGSVIKNDVIIINSGGNYVALSAICTHEKCQVTYASSANDLPCPCHGSRFDINGTVTKGPAKINLKKYTTTLSGNSLRVQS